MFVASLSQADPLRTFGSEFSMAGAEALAEIAAPVPTDQ
jgi:hypothetical protein